MSKSSDWSAARVWHALKETARRSREDNSSRLAAALSYYALLSIAPLLLVTVFATGLVFGQEGARMRAARALGSVLGPEGAGAIDMLMKSARVTPGGTLSSLLGLAVALFGASGVFVELQSALNTIWRVPPPRKALRSYMRERFWSFVMVLGVLSLLLASLVSSAYLSIVGQFFESALPGGRLLWQALNATVSLGILTLLFAVLFKFLPDTKIAWSDVSIGSFATALSVTLGNMLLGVYLGTSALTSSYGGAGSVIALVVWVYYSAQILFLGAHWSAVYASMFGSRRGRAPERASEPGPTASEGRESAG